MSSNPIVSIVTPVYNGEKWLPELAPQVLGQTMGDFEWIIVDDGSTDRTSEILSLMVKEDNRVRPLFPGRIGFVPALNLAIEGARAELIARQDVDDSSELYRLKLQTAHMLKHPEIGVLGGYWEVHNLVRRERFLRMPPTEHEALVRKLPIYIPFAHTLVMFRREAWRAAGGYQPVLCAEDLLLWIEMAARGWKLSNLPVLLGHHLVHNDSFFFRNYKYAQMMRTMARIQALAIRRLDLPWWLYIYPASRCAYAFMSKGLKQSFRRQILGEADVPADFEPRLP